MLLFRTAPRAWLSRGAGSSEEFDIPDISASINHGDHSPKIVSGAAGRLKACRRMCLRAGQGSLELPELLWGLPGSPWPLRPRTPHLGVLSVLLTGHTCPPSGHFHIHVSNSCIAGISKRSATSLGQGRSRCVSSYCHFLSCPSPWHLQSMSLRWAPPPPQPAPQPSVLGAPRPALASRVWLPSASDLQMANPSWVLPNPLP